MNPVFDISPPLDSAGSPPTQLSAMMGLWRRQLRRLRLLWVCSSSVVVLAAVLLMARQLPGVWFGVVLGAGVAAFGVSLWTARSMRVVAATISDLSGNRRLRS